MTNIVHRVWADEVYFFGGKYLGSNMCAHHVAEFERYCTAETEPGSKYCVDHQPQPVRKRIKSKGAIRE